MAANLTRSLRSIVTLPGKICRRATRTSRSDCFSCGRAVAVPDDWRIFLIPLLRNQNAKLTVNSFVRATTVWGAAGVELESRQITSAILALRLIIVRADELRAGKTLLL